MSKRKFTEEEVKELVYEFEVERIQGEDRRWSRCNTSIVNFEGKRYSLTWEEGLTEMQENEFYEQEAPEVKRVEETTVVKKWVELT